MKLRHPATQTQTIDRDEAARLLRAARAACEDHAHDDPHDAIDWAFAALPERRHPRRLKVESLLRDRDLEAADALIAQGLLLRPADAPLMLLRARSLLIRRDLAAADREIRLVLAQRPSHVASLVVGAEIARARADFPRARHLVEEAMDLRPGHDGLRARLAEILLDAECIDRAKDVIDAMTDVSPRLQARLLRASGRRLDAVDVLEAARSEGDPDGAVTRDLIDALESIGAIDRLSELLESVDASCPATLVRAGSAWLALGAYERVIDRLAPLREGGAKLREALSVSVVAAALLGRVGVAERLLTRLQGTPAGADPRFMAESWRRGLTSHTFLDQARTGRAEASRGQRMIDPLLHAALEVFDAEPASRTPARRAEIQRHRALCLATLGRDRDAAAAVGLAAADRESASQPASPPALRTAA